MDSVAERSNYPGSGFCDRWKLLYKAIIFMRNDAKIEESIGKPKEEAEHALIGIDVTPQEN